ncbi:MAG: CoA transferase [Candidatus Latescibacteria bacterium]|nr:CoA transferase [Candidatus Latescibacterota bacterium]NIM21731.1 CoA transferase [Candidatus Latescibacterota bacterium]NIM65869.1 CoA transferase [Candidatus Latescibacterota bacterium]NIO02614.1 CoA transferase [Candidatus Latescibacterota bacterium]NIO29595.1 CoA transferase [Candidatus Latescibacterota bacterium]
MKPQVVLSVEQALTMTYATLRFVHLGWRVIKVEPTPAPGRKSKGDPNRYIGRPVAGEDRHSYFVAPNVGKEAIAIDLKKTEGHELLQRLIRELGVDVFCTNTLPARHQQLGFDYETLRKVREDLIWCGISAMGLNYPDVPGYDPVLQAWCGYMDLTGHSDGPPLQCGIPLVDLKAGDEAFTQIILALMERMETGKGKQIDISMAQVAISWLHTFFPMLDMGSPPSELKRSGNEHRQFIPVNAYKTMDGYIYVAIGSDAQWIRITKKPMFASLDQERFSTNESRRQHKAELHANIEAITSHHASAEISEVLSEASIPHSPITPIEKVTELLFAASTILRTTTPDGRAVRLPPPAVKTDHLERSSGSLPFAPAYGEHTDSLLAEAGLSPDEIASLRDQGVVA